MVRIGLITERPIKKRKHIFEGYEKQIIYSDKNPFELVVAVMPFNQEQIVSMRYKALIRRIKRAESLLKTNDVQTVVVSAKIKELLEEPERFEGDIERKRGVFLCFLPLVTGEIISLLFKFCKEFVKKKLEKHWNNQSCAKNCEKEGLQA